MANMLLSQELNVCESNQDLDRQQFGLGDMNLVLSLLSKLYSNPIQTLTQEYISNARDANREINSNRAIEIQAPTKFIPVMSIRDFGPGITPDRMANVFCFYGSSTKRASNSQVGGWGVGSKSAFSYTDSFNIITYIDGMKRMYIAHKSNNNGNLDLISTESTTESNGTEIQIAVNPHDVSAFKRAIQRAIFYWNTNEYPVLKGFDKSELVTKESVFKLDNLELVNSGDINESVIVVDGIAYPNKGYTPLLNKIVKNHYSIHIANSKVNIAPNREELINDDITKAYLAKLDSILSTKLNKYLSDKLQNQTSLSSALKENVSLYNLFRTEFKFKNYYISYNALLHSGKDGKTEFGTLIRYKPHSDYAINKTEKQDRIILSVMNSLYYNDIPNESKVKINWRIRKLLVGGKSIMILNSDLDKEILSDLNPIMLSTIDASDYKVERNYIKKSATPKEDICLHYYNGQGVIPTQVALSEVTETILYDTLTSTKYTTRQELQKLAYWLSGTNKKIAFIAETKVKLIANNPLFIKIDDYINTLKPTERDIKVYLKEKLLKSTVYRVSGIFKSPLDKQIPDKEYNYLSHIYKIDLSGSNFPLDIGMLLKNHPMLVQYETMVKWLDIFPIKYPLLTEIENFKNTLVVNDLITYIKSKN
jgi:hypothetical protein